MVHQLVLRDLLNQTTLAHALGLWDRPDPPVVRYEPFSGLFDLSLEDVATTTLIELKVGAEVGAYQRDRQRQLATRLSVPRVYLLLGPAFFMALTEPDARNIGTPELALAVRHSVADVEGAIGELGRAYADRLEADALAWTATHDPASTSGLDYMRIYREIAAAWPVAATPSTATNPGGRDWILGADAWTTSHAPGWGPAQFYWEIVNGRTRFKLHWGGDVAQRRPARAGFRAALELAGAALGESVARTRAKLGGYMTAAEFAEDARVEVLVDGRVDAERARRLYDRATAVFLRALDLLEPMPEA